MLWPLYIDKSQIWSSSFLVLKDFNVLYWFINPHECQTLDFTIGLRESSKRFSSTLIYPYDCQALDPAVGFKRSFQRFFIAFCEHIALDFTVGFKRSFKDFSYYPCEYQVLHLSVCFKGTIKESFITPVYVKHWISQ